MMQQPQKILVQSYITVPVAAGINGVCKTGLLGQGVSQGRTEHRLKALEEKGKQQRASKMGKGRS